MEIEFSQLICQKEKKAEVLFLKISEKVFSDFFSRFFIFKIADGIVLLEWLRIEILKIKNITPFFEWSLNSNNLDTQIYEIKDKQS